MSMATDADRLTWERDEPNDPAKLRAEAKRFRNLAEENNETNPTAADYFQRRADWCEYLARNRESEATG